MTWDNGNDADSARLVSFQLRLSEPDQEKKGIEISLAGTFKEPDLLSGSFKLDGERLEISWFSRGRDEFSKKQGIRADAYRFYSVLLQRVNSNDPQTAAQEAAAEAPDLQALQGQWRIAKVVGAPDDDVQVGHHFLFQDNTLRILHRNADDITRPTGPVLLKTTENPKQIVYLHRDLVFLERSYDTRRGIYRIDKDRLEICWRIDDRVQKEAVPTKFEVGNDAKALQLISLERVTPAAAKGADEKGRLVDLQKALVETLQAQVDSLESRMPAGRDSLITILQASEQLMNAQLELATDKKSRIHVLEASLQRLLLYEKLKLSELNAGKATAHEMAQARAKRLATEILLEKEKAK